MEAWPIMSCTTFSSTPAARARVAAPWRRSWSRTGGSPAALARARKWRVSRSGASGSPPRPVNTYPGFPWNRGHFRYGDLDLWFLADRLRQAARGGQRRRSRLRQGVARAAGRPVSRGLTPGLGQLPLHGAEHAQRGVPAGGVVFLDPFRDPGPYVVLAVFHLPVAAVTGQQVGGVGLPGGQAGDAVHGLGPAQRVPVQVEDLAVDAERLVHAGETRARDVGTGPDGADLAAAVTAVSRDVVRGKRPVPRARAGTAPRCRAGGWAGCR